jgi:putative ABC transport system permease protein
MMSFGINPEGKSQDATWTSAAIRIDDFDLLDTYRMTMAAGRYFSPDRPTDRTHAVVINEALVRTLGWTNEEAIGRRLDVGGEVDEGTVIGVIRDFNFESLRRPIQPLLLYYAPRHGMLSVRLSGEDLAGSIGHIRETWEAFDPVYPFEYSFLDRDFAALYENERGLSKALGVFAVLALLVACFGLVGLAAYAAERRTKEIGIRKVLGATVAGVVGLLTREVVGLVLLAAIVAVPAAWLLGNRWLSGFAFRAGGTIWIIVAAALATLLLALLTVSWQAWRAASADPVNSLRYE